MIPGTRHNIPRLRVTQYTFYLAKLYREEDILKHRYAFQQEGTGIRFVYTGKRYDLVEGQIYDLRATIKREKDQYGYIRLSRIRKIEIDPELPL